MLSQPNRTKREFDALRTNALLPQFCADTVFPLFCYLPDFVLDGAPQRYHEVYHNRMTVWDNDAYQEFLHSAEFIKFTSDAYAKLMWPAFGIKTYFEGFSQDDPIWLLAHEVAVLAGNWRISFVNPMPLNARGHRLWPEAMLKIAGHGLRDAMLRYAEHVIAECHFTPVIAYVRKHRCFEDYNHLQTRERKTFERDWYHRRAFVQVHSYEALFEPLADGTKPSAAVQEPSYRIEDDLCGRLSVQQFLDVLSTRDAKILRLRMYDYTLQEIADIVGFSTHSAVKKRMNKIKRTYIAYCETLKKENAKPKMPPAPKPPPLWIFR